MRKISGKRYCRGKSPGFAIPKGKTPDIPLPRTIPAHQTLPIPPQPAHGRVTGSNLHQIQGVDWKGLWRVLSEPARQMPGLLCALCMVARSGTLRGRYIRVTAVQAEMVLGLVMVFGLAMMAWVIPIVIRFVRG